MSRRYGTVSLVLALFLLQAGPWTALADHVPTHDGTLPLTLDRSSGVYWEGERVVIDVASTSSGATGRTVRVYCLSDCPPNPEYAAPVADEVTFPSPEFCQLDGGLRNCDLPTAADLLEPRWAGEWVASLHDAAGLEIYRVPFQVRMTNADDFDGTFQVADVVRVIAGGFTPGTYPTLTFGSYDANDDPVIFHTLPLLANAAGQIQFNWFINKEIALHITSGCPDGCSDFFARALPETGTPSTKDGEIATFRVEPADLRPDIRDGPGFLEEDGAAFERTSTVPFRFRLLYGNRVPTTYQDFPNRGEVGSLRVEVHRLHPETGESRVVVELRPGVVRDGEWETPWEVPKDLRLNTPNGNAYEFQFVIMEGRDLYGNNIVETRSSVFTVDPARIHANYVVVPEELERTELGEWYFKSHYHNGDPFNSSVNATEITGHIVRVTEAGDVRVTGSKAYAVPYEEELHFGVTGVWILQYAFPKDYEPTGTHAIVLDGGPVDARDKWGNYLITNRSGDFELKVAVPRLQLTEKDGSALLDGATDGWTRGQNLQFVARLTYPDGSAYNATQHHEQGVLNVTLIKRQGEQEVERLVLPFRQRSPDGTWTASHSLTLTDSATPLGTWDLIFDLRDRESPANAGQHIVERVVHPSPILVYGDRLIRNQFLLGETIRWTFDLEYENRLPVTDREITTPLVDVYRWSGENLLSVETSDLPARYTKDRGWTVDWQPPSGVRLGQFVFVPHGSDKYGNPLEEDRSDPFSVVVPTIEREVLAHPPPVVTRNETVYVTFDGLEGDAGEDETGNPRISVERWNGRIWVVEVEDVYASGSDAPGSSVSRDHFGAWHTGPTATLGTYRFVLYGRDAQRAYVNATSAPFELTPLEAARTILVPPAASVPKGGLVEAFMESRPGDRLGQVNIIRFGEHYGTARFERHNETAWRVHWVPTFILPSGNYTLEVVGTDLDGNRIIVATPPISITDVEVSMSIVRDLEPRATRGEEVSFTFRAFLPDGRLSAPRDGTPRVHIERDGQVVQTLTPTFINPNWEVTWEVPMDLELGEYDFRISGRDDAGNRYADTIAGNVTVVPGIVERSFSTPPASTLRLKTVTASAIANRTDTTMSCFAAYAGTAHRDAKSASEAPAITDINITFEWDPGDDVYALSWTPGPATSLGWYRFECKGADVHQNTIRYRSLGFQLNSLTLQVAPQKPLSTPEEDFQPGALVRHVFVIRYPDGELFGPELGTASVRLTYEGIPVEPQPAVRFDPDITPGGAWVAQWQAPDVIPPGTYLWVTGGEETWDNIVPTHILETYEVEPGVSERLFGIPGFEKAVPGAGGALTLLALLGAVAVAGLARRRR